jgi:type IX secretion system PorP/SprF family membrane protein
MKSMTAVKASIILLLVLVMGTISQVNAQYDAMFTQYMNNEMFINPAYAGSKEALCVTALHRQQWVGMDGRPITTTVTAHAPLLANTMGIGISFLNEKIGVTNRNMIYLTYAYRIRTGDKSHLSFGLMGGIHIQSDRLGSVVTIEGDDHNFLANTQTVTTPNFGFGMAYTTDKFFAGFSIPRLIDDHLTIAESGNVLNNLAIRPAKCTYYFYVGRVFTVNEYFKLKPSLMMKTVANAPVQLDVNLSALIREHLWLGLSYRSGADMSAMIGVQISPRFLINYSYDYPLSSINKFSSGSHEIVLSALFGYKGKKIVSNRYF